MFTPEATPLPNSRLQIERARRTSGHFFFGSKSVSLDHSHYFVHELHIGGKCLFDVTGDLANIIMQGDAYALSFYGGQ